MPSASQWLGYYVTTRKRGDGTFRVLFEVPARLRPSDWPSQIKLPREGFRRHDGEPVGDVNGVLDAEEGAREVAQIIADGNALYQALQATKKGDKAASLPVAVTRKGTIPWLIRRWGGQILLEAAQGKMTVSAAAIAPGMVRAPTNLSGASQSWLDCEPRSRKFYIRSLRHVFAWSITIGHRHVRAMTPTDVRDFLDLWNHAPGQRKNIRGALSQILAIAEEESELRKEANPLLSVRAKKRKRVKGGRRVAVERWTRADVDVYAATAAGVKGWRGFKGAGSRAMRTWPGGARCVRLMHETAADSTDVIVWTQSEHLKTKRITLADGEAVVAEGIEFDRGKTGQPAFIPLSRELVAEIRASGSDFMVTDPFGQPYEPVIDDARLRGHLITLREKVAAGGGPHRVFDHLRHSAITEGVERGIAIEDMMHLSAHADSDMNKEVYVQRSAAKAYEIQRARGLTK